MLIGGYQPFSLSDFPGKPAAIIFTQGCNFRCPYCHNRQLWPLAARHTEIIAEERVVASLAGRRGLLEGVVVTGGEPTMQSDIRLFLERLQELGLAVKLDTNGSDPEVVKSCITAGLVDYIAMDIKAPAEKYDQLAGCQVTWSSIQQSIELIRDGSVPHHFRTTFDRTRLTNEDIQEIERLVAGENLVVQKCH